MSELVSVSSLLYAARELVREEARAKSLRVIIVGVDEQVIVNRGHVVLVIASLLRDAIDTVQPGGRVAVTGQELDRELVFAVYDSGTPSAPASRFDEFAAEAAHAIGGRVWTAHPLDGNLSLFSLPLAHADN
ncbi:MAG TPA: hypothetical protein VM513_25010 [Kofleriaceae bacterium]|jgi:hypothetical protein|nr:hypothetical protein [Kofleriaceae bacterium]